MKTIIAAATATVPLLCPTGAIAQDQTQAPITRIFEFQIAPENIEDFIAAGKTNVLTSIRDEPGVLSIYVTSVTNDPTRFFVIESYRDEAAYEAHRTSAHFNEFLRAVDGKFLSRRVIETTPAVLGAKSFTWSAP